MRNACPCRTWRSWSDGGGFSPQVLAMPCTDAACPVLVADDPAWAGAWRHAEVSWRWSSAFRALVGHLRLWRPAVPDRLLGGPQEPRAGHDDARRGRDFGRLFLFCGGDFRLSWLVLLIGAGEPHQRHDARAIDQKQFCHCNSRPLRKTWPCGGRTWRPRP